VKQVAPVTAASVESGFPSLEGLETNPKYKKADNVYYSPKALTGLTTRDSLLGLSYAGLHTCTLPVDHFAT
jgi:hypothetical protein